MNTPDIEYIKPPDDEPTVFIICNDLIRALYADARSRCSDNTPAQEAAS